MIEFIKKAFFENKYILIHFVGGWVYSMLHIPFFEYFFGDRRLDLLFVIVLTIAILWEVYEFFSDGGYKGIEKIYGKFRYFIYDGIGDIIAPLLACLFVSLF